MKKKNTDDLQSELTAAPNLSSFLSANREQFVDEDFAGMIQALFKRSGLSKAALAKKAGISEVYLRKLFLTYYKITPKQYILDIRLSKAKQLLVDTAFTVTDIARECGFASLYHFCRCFKKKTGTTPTEYAKNNRIYQI